MGFFKLVSKALDNAQKALDQIKESIDRENQNTNNYQEININASNNDPVEEPFGLDVFGNYLYLNDKIIPIAYNDKRYDYVTINANYSVEHFTNLTGPIDNNVIKYSAFIALKKADKVKVSKNAKFLHVYNFD